MWYSFKYEVNDDGGITPHVVQGDLVDWHNEYIETTYNKKPLNVTELDAAYLDPGGMLITGSEPLSFQLDEDKEILVKKEHVLGAADYFFNREIYKIAKSHKESKIHPDLRIRVIEDKIVKVYLSYYILVLSKESYLSICDFLEDEYINGMNEYLDMMDRVMQEQVEAALLDYASLFVPAEA